MRALPILLAALVAIPLASAQTQTVPPPLAVQADPLPPAAPLRERVQAPVRIDVSCLLAAPGQQIIVHAWVAQTPAWAQAVVSPAFFQVDPTRCAGARTTLEGVLSATANDAAPAWTPAPIVVSASVEGAAQGNQTASGSTNLSASYFGALDAGVAEAVGVVAPGAARAFSVRLVNHGNDATRVSFRLANASDWLRVDPIPDVVLGSAQQGTSPVAQEVAVTARPASGSALTNRVGTFTLAVTSVEARAPGTPGDNATLSFVLTEKGRATPAAPTAWVVAGVALAALLRRLR